MKKLGMAFVMALLALAFVAGPVLADGGNASVTCSDIDVTDDEPAVGTTITFSGNVDVVSYANYSNTSYFSFLDSHKAYAESSFWYRITDPKGNNIVEYYSIPITISDPGSWTKGDHWWKPGTYSAEADASYLYSWYYDVDVELVGDYIAEQGGEAYAYYGYWKLQKVSRCNWEWVFVKDDEFGPEECSAARTATAHIAASLSTGRTRPILTVQSPMDSELYFTSDGWGNPTSDVIVYNDGTWQVEIADGTKILLDGEWHRKTWIEVDSQGNVIGRYGSDGHIIAEEIALSSPITITKVG